MHLLRALRRLTAICIVFTCIAAFAARTEKAPQHPNDRKNHPVRKVKVSNTSKTHARSTKTAANTKRKSGSTATTKPVAARPRGQQSIDGDRAREIQQALIREKYLDGEPTGSWDQRTKEAMVRYQTENGWQTRVVPDSRALIKLGLGPKRANLLNPENVVSPVTLPDSARDMRPGGSIAATATHSQ